jgi:predicted membrane-bound spermidine synthase
MDTSRKQETRPGAVDGQTIPPRGLTFLIFFTGAATLSLEVLASRLMTPYFGVSLYIWAGILSITLIFLATGYYLGGKLTAGRSPQSLLALYLVAPLFAALILLVAALTYPVLFPLLARGNLIVASFVGGSMLLAFPLILLSAMNPLLIALDRCHRPEGDSGAGRVFFISTIGSVAGVLVTAFLIIPQMTNFRAVLGISLGLCVATGWTTWLVKGVPGLARGKILLLCCLVALLSLLLQWGHRGYLRLLAAASGLDQSWEVLVDYPSVFGNIKVVAVYGGEPRAMTDLLYVQDGIIQNHYNGNGQAMDHTPMMLHLAELYASGARQAGVLGLAAGAIPRQLKAAGLQVTVAEINPQSLQAAMNFFGYDPQGIEHHWEDARTLVRRHPQAFDLILVDLFQGDATPEYLLTLEFFADLKRSLKPDGLVIMNLFFDNEDDYPNQRLLATITAAFPQILELRAPSRSGKFLNAYVVAGLGPLSPALAHQEASKMSPADDDASDTLASARLVRRQDLAHLEPVTDEHNIFPYLLARSHVRTRSMLSRLPYHLLIN